MKAQQVFGSAAVLAAGVSITWAAAPVADTAQAVKRAARAVAPAGKTLEIGRAVEGWALVNVLPGGERVLLRRTASGWKAVGRPSSATLGKGNRRGAPEWLFDDTAPYVGANGERALARLKAGRKTFRGARFTFQYPSDAKVTTGKGAAAKIVGPMVRTPIYTGAAYEITVRPLNATSRGPLDEWAYDRLAKRVQKNIARYGKDDATAAPESATYFHPPGKDVFQIDWFNFDSVVRELQIAPKGGGPVVEVSTVVYPVGNNPAAPQAEGAVTLVLHTLTHSMGTR